MEIRDSAFKNFPSKLGKEESLLFFEIKIIIGFFGIAPSNTDLSN